MSQSADTLPAGLSFADRMHFSPHAEPFALGEGRHQAHGYAWRHPNATAALVFVHGLQSHSQWFAEAGNLLHKRGLAVFALDRRGSGSSPESRGHIGHYKDWFRELAVVVRHALDENPERPVHLVGHCFGANIATGYALRRPGRIRSIIMLTPGFYVIPDYTPMEKLKIAADSVANPKHKFRVPQDDDLFTRNPEVLAWIEADTLGAKRLTAWTLMQTNSMLRWLRREAGRLDVPVLVFEAARDRLSDNVRNRALMEDKLGARVTWTSLDAEHYLLAEPVRDDVLDGIEQWVALIG